MSGELVDENAERIGSAFERVVQLRERTSRLQRAHLSDLAAAQKAADEARSAALSALRYASEAHAGTAKAHRDFAAVLEDRGEHERAEWHRQAAVAEEEAAATALRRLAERGGAP